VTYFAVKLSCSLEKVYLEVVQISKSDAARILDGETHTTCVSLTTLPLRTCFEIEYPIAICDSVLGFWSSCSGAKCKILVVVDEGYINCLTLSMHAQWDRSVAWIGSMDLMGLTVVVFDMQQPTFLGCCNLKLWRPCL